MEIQTARVSRECEREEIKTMTEWEKKRKMKMDRIRDSASRGREVSGK